MLPSIRCLDIFGNELDGLGAGFEMPVMYQFVFEQPPEAFHGRVVIASFHGVTVKRAYRTDQAVSGIHEHSSGCLDPSDESVHGAGISPRHHETRTG